MEKQFATMVPSPRGGAICLEKTPSQNWTNRGTPTVYAILQVQNGHRLFQGKPQGGGYETLPAAIGELFRIFQMEMDDRNYELRIPGEEAYNGEYWPDNLWPSDTVAGWYDLNNPSSGPAYSLSDYPADPAEWVSKGITSYAYDNYRVTIVTSNWKEVRL